MTGSGTHNWTDLRDRLVDRIEGIVTAWKAELAPTGYVPLSANEQRQALTSLTHQILDVLVGEPFMPEAAAAVGARLVTIGFTRPPALARTLEVFGRELITDLPEADMRRLQPRLASVLAELGAGFAHQISERILGEQETIREALLTQRDDAEQALRESEARFRAMFEQSPFGIAVADMQGRILTANRALQTILGYSESEMRGHVILAELSHPDDSQVGFENFVALAQGRLDHYELEQRFFARDGRIVWAQLAMALVRDSDGKPQFAIGMGQDITERKQAEAERIQLLREQAARAEAEAAQARLAFLADASAQLVSSLDYETTLKQVAQSVVPRFADWCTLHLVDAQGVLRTVATGHSSTALAELAAQIRLDYSIGVSPAANPLLQVLRRGRSQFVPEVTDAMLKSISTGAEQLDLWHRLAPRSAILVPLGGQRGVLGTLVLITTSESDRSYSAADLALAEDLARRVALAVENAQLYAAAQVAIRAAEDAVRAREEFLSVAAHELKTPVTSLRGFAQLTLRALDQDAELDRGRLRHALMVVNQQSDKLTRLVAQLLDISRIQSGRLALEVRPVDISQLIVEVVTAMQNQWQNHDLRIDRPDQLELEIDALRIEQVLTNLLDNAIKYSPQGGPIDIDVSTPDASHVRVSIRDYGPGIRPEHRGHIFERFYQAGEDAQHAAGMGLGLYISHEIVELHGGTIDAEFPPDGGAKFVITLPR